MQILSALRNFWKKFSLHNKGGFSFSDGKNLWDSSGNLVPTLEGTAGTPAGEVV